MLKNRQKFLSRFRTLCQVYDLTYSEARFHPYTYHGKVELEFFVSGYRLWIHDFNELAADSLVTMITSFAENKLNDEKNIDIIAPAIHHEFSCYSPYSLVKLPFREEYMLWDKYYREQDEPHKAFYLEQDLIAIELADLTKQAEIYGEEVRMMEFENTIQAEKELYSPNIDNIVNDLRELTNKEIVDECSKLGEPTIDSGLGVTPISREKTKTYDEIIEGREITWEELRVSIPTFHEYKNVEIVEKSIVKDKLMMDFSAIIDNFLHR
jgi:hypothetical protein